MVVIGIIIIIIIGILAISRGLYGFPIKLSNNPESIGSIGENRVHNILLQLPEEYQALDNLMLKTDRGTTQIDHIVVSKYGVFAIETKNYCGDIYGNDNTYQWKQIIRTDVNYIKKWWKTYTYVTKNYLYNPVKQSLGHTYAIKKVLKEWPNLKIIPIVVFVGDADLSNVKSRYHVIYGGELLSTIQSYNTVYLSDSDTERIYSLLIQLKTSESVTKREHEHNIEVAKTEKAKKISQGICPQCGGKLVLRTGKFGQFYGCSNYPKCKFTLHE